LLFFKNSSISIVVWRVPQHPDRPLQSQPGDEFVERLSHQGPEDAVKVARRKTGDVGQLGQRELFAEVFVDVIQQSIDPRGIFMLACGLDGNGHGVLRRGNK
jgi:hypothetical protein